MPHIPSILLHGAVGSRNLRKSANWGSALQGAGGLASGVSAFNDFDEGRYGEGATNAAMSGSLLGDMALKRYSPQIGKVIGSKGLSWAGKAVPFLGTVAYASDAARALSDGRWSSAIGNGAGALFNAFGLSPIALGLSSFGEGMDMIGRPDPSAPPPAAPTPRYRMSEAELAQLSTRPPASSSLGHLQGLVRNYFGA